MPSRRPPPLEMFGPIKDPWEAPFLTFEIGDYRTSVLIDMEYQNIEMQKSKRRVHVIGLYFRAESVFFVGKCELRNQYRSFRMDGVEAAWNPRTGEILNLTIKLVEKGEIVNEPGPKGWSITVDLLADLS